MFARDNGATETRLVAYIVAAEGVAVEAASLRCTRRKSPAYMIPSSFVFVEHFPLTPNGKLDRRALIELNPQTRTQSRALWTHPAATESIEDRLAIIWRSLLKSSVPGH